MWKSTQFHFSRCEMAVHGQYLDVPAHTTVQFGCLYGCQNMSNLSMLDRISIKGAGPLRLAGSLLTHVTERW